MCRSRYIIVYVALIGDREAPFVGRDLREASRMTVPLAITKAEAVRLTSMPRIVQRWLFHGWVEVVRPGGRGRKTIIDYRSLAAAYDRYRRGEAPPLLPSELKPEGRSRKTRTAGLPPSYHGED